MYELLHNINARPQPYAYYTAEALWADPYISSKMLAFHLDENCDPASRNMRFLKRSLVWIAEHFKVGPGKKICDFGCGPGLYTIDFAQRGAQVTGIDFSPRSIIHARETAKQKTLDIEYVQQNYLEFASEQRFDLITMIYCDFCALSPVQRQMLLGIFRRHLSKKAVVLFDVFSLAAYERRAPVATYGYRLLDGFWSAEDYYAFLNTFKYESEKVILDKYTIFEKSRRREIYNWLQYYSLDSLAEEVRQSGFEIVEHYADVAGSSYREDADEIAVVLKLTD